METKTMTTQTEVEKTAPTTAELFDSLVADVGEELDAALPVILPGVALTDMARRIFATGHSVLLAQRRHQDRTLVKTAFVEASKPKPARKYPPHPRAAAAKAALMDHWKIGTVSIRNASRDLLLLEAQRDGRAGEGLLRNANFYAKLAALVPEGKTLGEACSEADFMRVGVEVFGDEQAVRKAVA